MINNNIEKQNMGYQPLEVPEELSAAINGQGKVTVKGILIVLIFMVPVLPLLVVIHWDVSEYKVFFLLYMAVIGTILIIFCESTRLPVRVSKFVRNFIADRNIQTIDFDKIWQDPARVKIADRINHICIEQADWEKNSIFLPEDSFGLMITLYTGDLDEVECIEAIEQEFFLKIPDAFFKEEKNGDLKFKDMVDYILQNSPQYAGLGKG